MNFYQILLTSIKLIAFTAIVNMTAYAETELPFPNSATSVSYEKFDKDFWDQKADEALANKEYDEAIKALENILWYNPKDKKHWIDLYRSYSYVKQKKYALNSLKKALQHFPEEIYFWIEKTKIYMDLYRFDDAIQAIKKVIALDPDNIEGYVFLTYILYEQKQYDEALKNILKAKQINNNYSLLYQLHGNIYAKQKIFNEAINEYTQGIKITPSPRLYIERAKAYFQLQQYEKSFKDLQNTLALEPFSYEAWDYKGRIFYIQGEYDQSLEAFKTSLAIDPRVYGERDQASNYLYQKERYQEIVKLYNVLLKQNPNDPDIWNNRAEVLFRLYLEKETIDYLEQHHINDNQNKQASTEEIIQAKNFLSNLEKYAKKALELYPDSPRSWFFEGFISYQNLDFDEAAKAFEKSIDLGLDLPIAYRYLSRTYESMGMFDDAKKVLITALQQDIYHARIWYQYALFLNKAGLYDQSLQALDQGLKINRHLAYMWSLQGQIHLKLGYPEKALDSFEQALAYQPTNDDYLMQLGRSYAALTFFDDAINVFDSILDHNPQYVPAYVNKAKTYFKQGKYQRALDKFNKALRLDSENFDIMLEVANTMLKLEKDIDEAYEIVSYVLQHDLGNYKAWLLKGIIYYMKGNFFTAKNALQNSFEIIHLNPDNIIDVELKQYQIQTLYYQSLAAFKTGDYEHSLKYINEALELKSDDILLLRQKIMILQRLGNHNDEIAFIQEQIKQIDVSNYAKQKELRKNLAVKIIDRN